MSASEPSELAREWARLLLAVLDAAMRRAEERVDGGHVFLEALHRYVVKLLRELGGFDDILQNVARAVDQKP